MKVVIPLKYYTPLESPTRKALGRPCRALRALQGKQCAVDCTNRVFGRQRDPRPVNGPLDPGGGECTPGPWEGVRVPYPQGPGVPWGHSGPVPWGPLTAASRPPKVGCGTKVPGEVCPRPTRTRHFNVVFDVPFGHITRCPGCFACGAGQPWPGGSPTKPPAGCHHHRPPGATTAPPPTKICSTKPSAPFRLV